ncbi:protein slender lobes [Drosophila innubila]|uniref:protein slender lobes n=1 Tax=Drosophila innubila TaxID=198719 RepID=UPI00148CDBFF|nr:protein slender lobes [Drosophila innubila]
MDDDNNDIPRVTRARTRRLSTLDTDSRPSTPLLDATVERASPRPMRKTRLNSATVDLRTPTRSTRLSVARGETPEPITPNVSLSAAKRGTRTPAKSVRKPPFPLKEDLVEEGNEEQVQVQATAMVKETKTDVVTEATEAGGIADSTRKTPSRSVDLLATPNVTPTDERRVTRSMSKTPPVPAILTSQNIPQPQFDINNSLEEKQTKEVIENVDTPVIGEQLLPHNDGSNKASSITSGLNNNKLAKLQVKLKNLTVEKSDSQADSNRNEATVVDKVEPKDKEDTLKEDKPISLDDSDSQMEYNTPNESMEEVKTAKLNQKQEEAVKDKEDIVIKDDKDSQAECQTPKSGQEVNPKINDNKETVVDKVDPKDQEVITEADKDNNLNKTETQAVTTIKTNINEESVIPKIEQTKDIETVALDNEPNVFDDDVSMEELVVPPEHDQKIDVQVTEDLRLPDLTPKIMSRVLETKPVDSKKKVDFGGDAEAENDGKLKYPKTPARLNTPPMNIVQKMDKKDISLKAETPIKAMILKKRHSSTPLAKPESVLSKADDESIVTNPPPLQIDVIQPLSDLESKAVPVSEVQITKEKLARRLVSEDEDEDEEEEEEHDEEEPGVCEFFDNEVEVVDNYQSGDSMDSSERREILENEVPHDGESVGSQDTSDDGSEESDAENLSFIVSDNEVDEGEDDVEDLCFSSEVESVASDSKNTKKRRRIVVHDSSDEEDTAEKENESKEQSAGESANKSKNASGKGAKMLNLSKEKCAEKEPNKSISLNKTASVDRDDLEVEELHSTSDEGDENEIVKRNKSHNKSIYEVPDSSEESDGENVADNSSPTKANKQLSPEKEESMLKVDSPTPMDEDASTEDKLPIPIPDAVEKTVESSSKSSAFHNKEKRDDDAVLLSQLSSCDLSHLQQMFNPLQKSRRQTLYHQGPEMSDMEPKPKLKRRSEQLNSDVKPSQSFIETLAEEKSQRLKRKHMSKSFCGTADDLDTSAVQEVKSKKAKKTCDDEKTDEVESSATTADLPEQPKAQHEVKKPSDPPKDTAFYLDYCDTILQAANEAMLEQKKQRIASGKKPKSVKRSAVKSASDAVELPSTSDAVAPVTANPESEKATTLKKNVKRLQATKQAVKHAMQLLAPDSGSKEPQSLARKLSPQPPENAKSTKDNNKQTVKRKKPKVAQVSPIKSSDEENHHAVKRIKTSAGYVVISDVDKDGIELVKTRSGIVKVEPCTPRQKYFKEVPSTPYNRSGLSEVSAASKAKKKLATAGGQSNVNRNPATESALRFKREIFGRSSK